MFDLTADFSHLFIRLRDGCWLCVREGYWSGPPFIEVVPGMRYVEGDLIEGVDIAGLLEQQYRQQEITAASIATSTK